MRSSSIRIALIALACLGLIAAVRLAAWPLVAVALPPEIDTAPTSNLSPASQSISRDSVAVIASHDPFRIGRRPAFPPYDPVRLTEQVAPPPPRPTLVLVGLMDGIRPSAVIEGFPGVDGARVVHVGDVIAGLSIKKVGSGGVTIIGMDTAWVLQVREPWKD